MREFMTKVSDYWNERKNDPDRQENQLAVVVTAAVAVVIIVLLVILLWGYVGKRNEGGEAPIPIKTGQIIEEADRDRAEEEMMTQTIHEEESVKYMSEDSGEKLRQEYLTSTAYLGEKVEELLQTMTQVQDGLNEVIKEYQEADAAAQTQITTLYKEVETIVQSLKETQVKLVDLTDIVQVIDKEKIPMIQQQIEAIRTDMEQVQTDISGLHKQMAALKKEDERLWASISSLEKTVERALNQNVADVNNRIDQLQAGIDHVNRELEKILQENMDNVNERVDVLIEQMEEKIRVLKENTLRYRYEAESNTLYLMPMQEQEGGQ